MKAIIIAAGRGARMKHMTTHLPKCLAIVFNGKTLLETQLEVLRSCGISDISLIRGYQADKINYPGIRYYENPDYSRNNILASLFCAEPELNHDVIVSYSDIWYERDILSGLCGSSHDISLAVDINWKDTYQGRTNHPIEEAETVMFDSAKNVIKIGKIAEDKEEVHGEFIGLVKLTRRGSEILKRHYDRARRLYAGQPFQRAAIFEKAYLTDLLQEMTDLGVPIHCEISSGGWREIDTVEDFENAAEFFKKKVNVSS